MPARYDGFSTQTAVQGGTSVMKVRQYRFYSEPSDTYFEFAARVQTTPAQAQTIANGVSAQIEDLLGLPPVVDIAWSQEVTPSGQLIGIFTVYWNDTDNNTSGWVEIPYTQFNAGNAIESVLQDAGLPSGLP